MTTTAQQRKRKPRVRANGEGSVFRLPDGRWRATKTAYVVNEGGGKRKQKLITGSGATREIAIQRRDAAWSRWLVTSGQAPQSILNEQNVETHVLTVGEWFYSWHANLDPTNTTELYRRQILSRIELHIAPSFGKTALRLINREEIQKWVRETLPAKRNKQGKALLSENSIVNVFRTFSLGLDEAVKAGHIPANPAKSVTPPRRRRAAIDLERKKWIPLHLMQKLEGSEREAFYLIKLLYGLRISELLGLTDDSFMLSSRNPRIIIKHQLKRKDTRHGCGKRKSDGNFPCGKKSSATCPMKQGESGWYLSDPKSEAGIRTLPLVEPALSAVKAHLKSQQELRKSDEFSPLEGLETLAFTKPNGRPITPNDATAEWKEILEEFEVPYIRGHEVRHLTATMLAEAGVSLEVTKRILGHSEAAMTAYYTHVGEKATREPLADLARHITKRQKRSKEAQK